jgi:hypothetical protein
MDQECAGFMQARRTGNRASSRHVKASHVKASSEEPAEPARCHQDGWQEFTDSVESFGDGAAIPPVPFLVRGQLLTRVRRKVNSAPLQGEALTIRLLRQRGCKPLECVRGAPFCRWIMAF